MVKKAKKVKNRWGVVILAVSGILLLVANGGLLYFAGMPSSVEPILNDRPEYAMWDRDAEVKLAELPNAEEMAKQVRELLTVSSIPVVKLSTTEEVKEKSVYKELKMTIDGASFTGEIKPRGSSTYRIGLQYGVMPYKIKLDEAADLLGMGKSKKWCLIANFIDRSYVKQFLMYQMAQLMMGDGYFQPKAKYVEVYMNGEYKGLYLLTESIEEDEGRLGLEVDVENYDDAVPFLLEMQPEDYECKECFYANYDLAYPEVESLSEGQQEYIRSVIRSLNEDVGSGWVFDRLAIDANSFVNGWVFMDLFANPTYMGPSFYMYQKPGTDKMTMGPLWDFDTAMFGRTDGFMDLGPNTLYRNLFRYKAFQGAVEKRYLEYTQALFPAVREAMMALKNNQTLKKAVLRAEAKNKTWTKSLDGHNGFPGPTFDIPDPTVLSLKSYEAQVQHILDWLFDGFTDVAGEVYGGRVNWMNENLDEWGS